MTKCEAYWRKAKEFAEKGDFDGFCKFCGNEKHPDYLQEEWRIAQGAVKFQNALEISSCPADLIRPLIRKSAAPVRKQVIAKLKTLPKEDLTPRTVRTLINEFLGPRVPKPEIPKFEKQILEANQPHWTERIHVPVSHMEEEVFNQCQRMGINLERQKEFCIGKTVADAYNPESNLAIFLDGAEAHKDREFQDDLKRDYLRHQGVHVLSLEYGVYSPALAYALACEIRDQVKETVKVKAT